MRLLKILPGENFCLTEPFLDEQIPKYAILSHRWEDTTQEVKFEDMEKPLQSAQGKAGYKKIEFCGKKAAEDGLEYFWVDSCCINKSSDAELSESLNSMFRWYQRADKCYVYLSDVVKDKRKRKRDVNLSEEWQQDFRKSQWFTRGWTLQELLAPTSVQFFSNDGSLLGDKKVLEKQIHETTGIPIPVLRGSPLSEFSPEQKFSWAQNRKTTRQEDWAYSLLGIFNVSMQVIYGEGKDQAVYRLKKEIAERAKASADRNFSEQLPMLRNDSVFLQERLLVRDDVQDFLTMALGCHGHVRAVLHGLPGVGKSCMARSFAYNAQRSMAVLWIPANSDAAINQALQQYAIQMCGNDQQTTEPMSLITRRLHEIFSGRCLVVFDGLDDPLINIQQYLFADLEESKILITTRNKDLASHIRAAHVFPMSPLNAHLGHALLDMYIDAGSTSLTANQAVQINQTIPETDARKRIVKELGGLPLAIAIVGAALRNDNGFQSSDSQAYLTWSDEVHDMLLEQDPMFSDYSPSVWKSFQFAFRGILQGTGINQYAASMAYFVASCENASNVAEYILLYRKFRTRDTASVRSTANPCHPAIGLLNFLENDVFLLARKALAALNMVTVNSAEGGPDDGYSIEMHSLIRRWLRRTNHDKVFTYTGSKMWLLGFGMYDQLDRTGVETYRFEALFQELLETHISGPGILDTDPVPALEAVSPFLLAARMKLSRSIAFFPVASKALTRLHHFSTKLKSEITELSDEYLDLDWNSVFQAWALELEKQVRHSVAIAATRRHKPRLEDFFEYWLRAYVSPAFEVTSPNELNLVYQTETIHKIKKGITERTQFLLEKHLAPEAFNELSAVARNESRAFIRAWSQRWGSDVAEIIQRCLAEVLAELQSSTDTQQLITELSSPPESAAVGVDQNFGSHLQTNLGSRDSTQAFFVVVYRTVRSATKQFLDSCQAVEKLNEQKDTFRDLCKRSIGEGFGDRAADASESELLSAEAVRDTDFNRLWESYWPERFSGKTLVNLVTRQRFGAMSQDLMDAAKRGFSTTIENHLNHRSSLAGDLADKVFDVSSAMKLMEINWLLSGSDCLMSTNDNDDSSDEEPGYMALMHESKQHTLSAMKSIYDDSADVSNNETMIQALKSTFDCRNATRDKFTARLNHLGAMETYEYALTKEHIRDCDKILLSICLVLARCANESFIGSLHHLREASNLMDFCLGSLRTVDRR